MKLWQQLGSWVSRHGVQLGLTLRVTVAAVASLAIAQLLQLPLPLWAVLTAVIVSQVSVGRSLKATIDYMVGTLGGVVYGGAVAVLVPHSNEPALLAVLAIAVAPLALIAALKPSMAVAPITAIIVLLVPTITHTSAVASAFDRVLEVGVGGLTGFIVSFVLLPSRAHRQAAEAAAGTLDAMACALRALVAGLSEGLDMNALHRIQDGIGHSLGSLTVLAAEAEHERSAGIVADPHTGPLLRTLLRLRHDLIILGRAALVPLPKDIHARVRLPLERIGAVAADYLHSSGAALATHRRPPPRDGIDAAFDAYSSEVEMLRREGATRSLPAEAVERFFAFGFAFEQMRRNLQDLERCVTEWADEPASGEGDPMTGPISEKSGGSSP
jgi:uncharacterized membrane protein YccC